MSQAETFSLEITEEEGGRGVNKKRGTNLLEICGVFLFTRGPQKSNVVEADL